MGLTAEEIIQQAVDRTGMPDKKALAFTLLKNVIRNLETRGYWEWLKTSTTTQTENNIDEIAFSASKWPSAALTNYSKGLIVLSSETDTLAELPYPVLEALRKDDGATGYPKSFALNAQTLYLHPKPVTAALPLLTVKYLKQQPLPTKTTDSIATVCLIPDRYHAYLIEPVMSELYNIVGNESQAAFYNNIAEQNFIRMIVDNGDYRDIARARESDRIRERNNVTGGR